MTTKVKLIADGVITPDQITLTTASSGTNTTAPATTAFVQQEISALVDSSPDALNTLNELAAALGDDANFSTTVTNSIATKAPLASPTFTGDATFDTDTLVIDSTNNRLGIGTDSPNYPLTVSGSIESLAGNADEGGEIILRAPSGATNKKRFLLDTFKNGINTIFRIFNQDDSSGANGILRFVIDQDGNVGIGTSLTPGASLDIGDKTDAIIIPKGTTAQRPSSPANGMIRFNTTENKIEIYNGVGWGFIETTIQATGGTVTTDGLDKIHTFTSSGTFQVTEGTGTIEYLIVAGGAGGAENHGGGGGAGGLIYSSSYSLGVGSYTITVGAAGSGGFGGAGTAGGAGGNSAAFGSTAIGGGGGSGRIDTGQTSGAGNGGSGGGGCGTNPTTAGTGTSGQGNDGGAGSSGGTAGNGGGGGGAGAAGGAATGTGAGAGLTGTGGNGLQYSISGTSTYYAGGGSGGRWASGSVGAAGLGGGGVGGNNDSVAGANATVNTGGGGGGGGGANADGGNGGSGIVIIRYSTV
jgi:hypothetical protein